VKLPLWEIHMGKDDKVVRVAAHNMETAIRIAKESSANKVEVEVFSAQMIYEEVVVPK
jgi:hypothetical protein